MGMSEKFVYDSTGNIIQLDDIVLEYSPGDRLQRRGNTQYIYDGNGRLVKKIEGYESQTPKVWEFSWDAEDQLRKITTPTGEIWEYKYDALGRRIVKQGPKTTTRFVWNGNVVVHHVENKKVLHSSWVFDPYSFAPLCKVQNEQLYSVICDHLGTPRELLDVEGKVVWSVSYKTWGEVDEVQVKEVDCPIRFQGQWADEESGLHYNRFRYYDAQSGHFLSIDLIGLRAGTNQYHYTLNSVNWIDPFGLIIVYRNLRPDEDPAKGLSAKKPGRNMTLEGHIRQGSRHKGSQFISTTTDPDVAAKWQKSGQRTVKFDTDKVIPDINGQQEILDISTEGKAKAKGLSDIAANFASSSNEVAIVGRVPPDAMEDVTEEINARKSCSS